MARYALTNEGIARFRKRKTSVRAEAVTMEGYEIIDFLYENGGGTLEEIINHTGLSRGHVMEKLMSFMNRGFVEGSS